MSLEVVSGGVWVSTLGAVGELAYSTVVVGGCGEASWSMDLPPTYTHPALQRGQLVAIKAGPVSLWSGMLSEPDIGEDGKWTLHAKGLADAVDGYLCLTAGGATTSTPDVAIDAAITRGLPVTRPASLSNVAFAAGDETDAYNSLGDLLDAWSTSAGKRWGIDADRRIYASSDPTTPAWHITPGYGRFGLADDSYVTDIYMSYYGPGFKPARAHAGDTDAAGRYGRVERAVDGTNYGLIDSTKANNLAAGILAAAGPRLGWTEALTLEGWQVTTPAGSQAWLPLVRGGDMLRIHGVLDEQGQPVPYVDIIISEATYSTESDTLSVAPVGLVDRDLGAVLAAGAA